MFYLSCCLIRLFSDLFLSFLLFVKDTNDAQLIIEWSEPSFDLMPVCARAAFRCLQAPVLSAGHCLIVIVCFVIPFFI